MEMTVLLFVCYFVVYPSHSINNNIRPQTILRLQVYYGWINISFESAVNFVDFKYEKNFDRYRHERLSAAAIWCILNLILLNVSFRKERLTNFV